MSTLAYAARSTSGGAAARNATNASVSQAKKGFVDALAALVPAEALSAHAVIISVTTTTVKAKPGESDSSSQSSSGSKETPATPGTNGTSPVRSSNTTTQPTTPENPSRVTEIIAQSTLAWSFWALILLCLVLYVVPRLKDKWTKRDWFRAAIPPIAFVGWMMLQRTTAFDAIAPGMEDAPRTVVGLFIAIVLGVLATMLAPPPADTPAA
jgi:hypothetical protein